MSSSTATEVGRSWRRLLVGIALFGTFLFLTYYMQAVLGYSALKTGFAFLPFSAGIIFSATLASSLLPRIGAELLMCFGLALGAIGLALFTQIGVHTSYLTHVLPAELIVSIGLGFAFVPFSSTALIGVAPHDAGVAERAGQRHAADRWLTRDGIAQHSGGLGHSQLSVGSQWEPRVRAQALVHGYTVGFTVSASILVVAVVVAGSLVRASRGDLPAEEPALAVS